MNVASTPRTLVNLAGLIGGFLVGQGSLFIVQTWMVAKGHLAYIGLFGPMFTMAVFAYQALDFGGVIILAREVVRTNQDDSAARSYFWVLSTIRSVIALLTSVGVTLFVLMAVHRGFACFYAIGSIVGLVVFAWNAGGILDGRNLSGVTGLTSIFPTLTTAMVLPTAIKATEQIGGLELGLAYSIGSVTLVVTQLTILKLMGISLKFHSINIKQIREVFYEGLIYSLSWAPGQLFYRIQIAICSFVLGPAATGVFIYAKQVLNASGQLLIFARRVEFPRLIKMVEEDRKNLAVLAFSAQRLTSGLSIIGALMLAVGAGILAIKDSSAFHGAAIAIVIFSPTIVSGCAFATLTQAFAAAHRLSVVAWAANGMILGGLVAQFVAIEFWKLPGLAAGEALMQILGVLGLTIWIKFRPTGTR